ncbi:tol-pal system protein YbgF [Ancylobacter aquaticus]|uniref:Cell division coordinator CpoB n=1 Tax=Ancylobacter aquaticus TaxID=100 RepID=A0A4R1HLA9_ANCAQ|nr:tol-pal system protein YbgF [Ancylobacter aquaticus]TCK23214.1 tol-pal system protein YbgF [Ancylobacter aquaticus]
MAMMTVRPLRFAALVLVAALAASSAPFEAAQAQADNNFFGNLFKPPGQVRSGNQQAQPDQTESMVTRIDRLESQLRQMTGQMEQLQYRNQQLEQQLRLLQGDTGAGTAAAGEPARRPDVFDPAAQAGAPGAPRPLGGGGASGAPMDLGTLSGAVAGGSGQPAASPKELFDLGFGALQRQDYAGAGDTFEQFVKLYPTDRATPDAYYWLGESQYLRKSFKEAAQNFLKVSTDYPNAVKAPDALLRLGQSLAGIGEKDAACATLNAVGNKYPRASATVKQGVEREQKRAGC